MTTREQNPFETPVHDDPAVGETDVDLYIRSEVAPLLRADETIRWTAALTKTPPPMLVLLTFGLIAPFTVVPYIAAITNERVILIRTRAGVLKPKMENHGVETFEWSAVKMLQVGGLGNNRTIRFVFTDGSSRLMQIAPRSNITASQADFFRFAEGFESRP